MIFSRTDALPRSAWLLVAASMLVFLPGVAGPFALDDHVNLAPIWQWLQGQQDFLTTVFGNRSGPGGRPLAYLTLMANAWLGADATIGFKLVNLVLHAANSLLVCLLVLRLAKLARRNEGAHGFALLAAALWALHPGEVSTVLYVVQRMALLGAMAQLLAVSIYVEARTSSDPARAKRLLFLAFPLVVAIGTLAKESALIAPLLCLVVELVFFPRATRSRAVGLFFVAFIVLPGIAVLVWLANDPAPLTSGYAGREFTLQQRLFTQPLIALEYAANWFWPANLALYRDGHPLISTWTAALPAMVVGILLLGAALSSRRRWPLASFGALWFAAGHALEAGPFPLELYFEHRSYLPSLGLAVIVAAMIPARAMRAAWALVALFAILTLLRSFAWSNIDSLLSRESPPGGEVSRRLQVDRAIRAFETSNVAAREAALGELARGDANDRAAAAAWAALFDCDAERAVSSDRMTSLRGNPPEILGHNHVSWLGLLANRAVQGRCPGLDRTGMLDIVDRWESAAVRQPAPSTQDRLSLLRQQLRASP